MYLFYWYSIFRLVANKGWIILSCISSFFPHLFCNHNLLLLSSFQGISNSRKLLADSSEEQPVSSPFTPMLALESGKTEQKAVSKPEKVQAVLKGIKMVWDATFILCIQFNLQLLKIPPFHKRSLVITLLITKKILI